MAKLTWDDAVNRTYQTGVDHAVLYPQATDGSYPEGVAWNGITSISESPSGGDENAIYADNIKYLSLRGTEDYGGTIEALDYPDEFAECNGEKDLIAGVRAGQQARKPFGLVYRTRIGNATEGDSHGYMLHLVYNATASPSDIQHDTVNESPDAPTMSFEFTTTPVEIGKVGEAEFRPTSRLTINSLAVGAAKMQKLEEELFGSDGSSGKTPHLPTPKEVLTILA